MKVAALSLGLACAYADQPDDVKAKYAEWQAMYGGNGDEAELDVFADNLKRAEELQEADPSATYSYMSPFANLSPEQFSAYKGFASPSGEVGESINVGDLPASYDWRDNGAVNEIRDQKQCGSCWAFSVVANLEGAGFVETKKLVEVSEQQLVDCSHSTGDMGCQGGLPENTFQHMINKNMGLQYRSAYPYIARNGVCHADASQEVLFIKNWKKFSTDEDEIAAGLMQYGPLSIGINANTMQLYMGGIADPNKIACAPSQLDHGVAIVGFGSGAKPYWTIRNSWGKGWGEKGYYRIVRGKGSCGLNTDVTTAYDITIDGSIPEPPKPTPGPNTCEAKEVSGYADCVSFCSAHGGMKSFGTPGPHCVCSDGNRCDGVSDVTV